MAMSISTFQKLTMQELTNIIEYQNKFDTNFLNKNGDLNSSLRDTFTKMEFQLSVARKVYDNFLKQNRILHRKCAKNQQYSRRECFEASEILDSILDNN